MGRGERLRGAPALRSHGPDAGVAVALAPEGIIVTLGAEGCDLWQQGVRAHVPGVAATEVLDPTGCGDAFRAALLYGLERDWALERCVALGNKVGALKIASRGGQNHRLDPVALGI